MSKKAVSAEKWLESLEPVDSKRPTFVGSVTKMTLESGSVLTVWRRKEEVWGNYAAEDLEDYERAIGKIDPYYGREIVEAIITVTGVVRIELVNAAGCGVIVLWNKEAW